MSQLQFAGVHAEFLRDMTAERDLEGSLSCGKTTVALWSELEALKRWPGIWILIARWVESDVDRLLRPAFEQLARVHGTSLSWDEKKKYYTCENESRAFAFGLKTQSSDPEQRYGKIRGLPVSRIYVDQAEQLPSDIANELRLRLRPDIEARLRGHDYPRQLTFTPNPPSEDSWLAKQFPTNNSIKGRKYWCLSLYDNKHNLPADMIESAERTYPPEHPKHRTVILGQRGLNVMGDPIYENIFNRDLHVRELHTADDSPLIECFELGRHNPTWIIGQRTAHGGLCLLGGVLGRHLMLEDFIPIVKRYREDWFPDEPSILTCTSPMGENQRSDNRHTLLGLLREAGFQARWRENANAPDVQLAMIEEISGLLRRRTLAHEEAFGINSDPNRWVTVSADGPKLVPFVAFALEGGYVWSDHVISISHKAVRQPHEDDEYANAMHCVENLVLNFCIGQQTEAERQRRQQQQANRGYPSLPDLSRPGGWCGM